MAVRTLLHAAGLRYRVDRAPLPGTRRRADVVFSRARVAVFVDGCFWHACPERPTGDPLELDRDSRRDLQRLVPSAATAARRSDRTRPQ
ncbi:very short patch repair endonuclease [Nocardioides KLBMP 9356]|uniref:Very short patch repair endonuclease n=2 Tax=Nocardioides potassii TaxID=2911371 RepID=A0ABS9HD46_9ACTN|nr:very short patch repair endonuclease [Nocardioides potassii]